MHGFQCLKRMNNAKFKGVMLDTVFVITLLDISNTNNENYRKYYDYFLQSKIPIYLSTIALAEFLVRGEMRHLPLKDLRLSSFDHTAAIKSGEMRRILLKNLNTSEETASPRTVIINDIKILSQVETISNIDGFITGDTKGRKRYNQIRESIPLSFEYVDANIPFNEYMGELF